MLDFMYCDIRPSLSERGSIAGWVGHAIGEADEKTVTSPTSEWCILRGSRQSCKPRRSSPCVDQRAAWAGKAPSVRPGDPSQVWQLKAEGVLQFLIACAGHGACGC